MSKVLGFALDSPELCKINLHCRTGMHCSYSILWELYMCHTGYKAIMCVCVCVCVCVIEF